jgi:hypothetical protein
MKRKNWTLRIALLLLAMSRTWLFGDDTADVLNALQSGAQAKMTMQVVDSTGTPVAGAVIYGGFWRSDSPDDGESLDGITDTNGIFVANGKTINQMAYQISKDGHYKTDGDYSFYRQNEPCAIDGKWVPWGTTNAFLLKEIRQPVAMYAKEVMVKIPTQGIPLGYDFEKGDWVTPYGAGARSDLYFTYTETVQDFWTYSNGLVVASTNGQDGFVRLKKDTFSKFPSVYEAPVTGYLPEVRFASERTKTHIIRDEKLGGSEYLVFRVRSHVDADGNVTKANYGKIYGPLEFGVGRECLLIFSYYFNPTNNDPNIEFAPGQNLFEETDMARIVVP